MSPRRPPSFAVLIRLSSPPPAARKRVRAYPPPCGSETDAQPMRAAALARDRATARRAQGRGWVLGAHAYALEADRLRMVGTICSRNHHKQEKQLTALGPPAALPFPGAAGARAVFLSFGRPVVLHVDPSWEAAASQKNRFSVLAQITLKFLCCLRCSGAEAPTQTIRQCACALCRGCVRVSAAQECVDVSRNILMRQLTGLAGATTVKASVPGSCRNRTITPLKPRPDVPYFWCAPVLWFCSFVGKVPAGGARGQRDEGVGRVCGELRGPLPLRPGEERGRTVQD